MEVRRLKMNTRDSEYAPVFFGEGVVFVSHRKTDAIYSTYDSEGNYTSDLYYSIGEDGKYKSCEIFDPAILTRLNEGPCTFSPDQKTIYFTRGTEPKNKNESESLGIFISHLKGEDDWSDPEPFPFNSKDGSYDVAHPSMNSQGDRLYFASNMEGAVGGYDIFYCDLSDNGKWKKPVNLGGPVNTDKIEGFPFISENGKLFFSSSGHSEGRGMDIAYSVQAKDGSWSSPILLEDPINSDKNDFGIAIDINGNSGFFSSDRDRRYQDDIYSFDFQFPEFDDCRDNFEPFLCYLIKDDNITVDTLPFRYIWDLGDGTKAEGFEVEHCFPGYGSYDIYLQIIDTTNNQLFAEVSEVVIDIEKLPQPHITAPDTVFAGESVMLYADELDHVKFRSDGYYWEIGGIDKIRGTETEYVFTEPGTVELEFGMINIENPKEKVCVKKEVLVVDVDMLARLEKDEEFKEKGVYQLSETQIISLKDLKKADYLANQELIIDTTYYFIELTESIQPISLQDDYFKRTEREITERFVEDNHTYKYSVGEELAIKDLYPVYQELVDSGYTEATVMEDMKSDFDYETIKKGYSMPDSVRLALNKKMNEFADIHFDLDSYTIRNESFRNLDEIADVMQENQGMKVRVMAHTDNKGKSKYNLELSKKRANSVVKYLISKGIETERLIPEGYGDNIPIASNKSEEGRALNRRVEFEILIEEVYD